VTSVVVSKEKVKQTSQHVQEAFERAQKVSTNDEDAVIILDPVGVLCESNVCQAEATFAWDQHERMILSWWEQSTAVRCWVFPFCLPWLL
jgi:hypothetical protein